MDIKMKILIAILYLSIYAGYSQQIRSGEYFASINGFELHYVIRGEGPLLFVGHPTSGKIAYELTLKPLEKKFTMVYYDSRGTGKSESPRKADDYSYDSLVAEVEGIRQHLGARSIWLFGHSDQSAIALQYALKFPNQTAGIIITGTGLVGSWQEMIEYRQAFERERIENSEWFAQVIKDWEYIIKTGNSISLSGEDIKYAPLKWWCYSEETANKVIPIYEAVNVAGRQKPALDQSEVSINQHARNQIERYLLAEKDFNKITSKILIINGSHDTNNPLTKATKLHTLLTASELVIVQESGHFPWVEQPERFFMSVEKWLK
jgi:proline iminopeptidase